MPQLPALKQSESEIFYSGDNGICVEALGIPGLQGVQGHNYRILHVIEDDAWPLAELRFQNGPVPTEGVNGITTESVLAALKHRLEALNGMFSCAENEEAIDHVSKALEALERRTANRKARNVEGTYQV